MRAGNYMLYVPTLQVPSNPKRNLGASHNRIATTRKERSKVYSRHTRLLHQMDGGGTLGDNHSEEYHQVPMESHRVLIWDPPKHHLEQWATVRLRTLSGVVYRTGIRFKYSSSGHPQAKGQVQAINKSLLEIFKKKKTCK